MMSYHIGWLLYKHDVLWGWLKGTKCTPLCASRTHDISAKWFAWLKKDQQATVHHPLLPSLLQVPAPVQDRQRQRSSFQLMHLAYVLLRTQRSKTICMCTHLLLLWHILVWLNIIQAEHDVLVLSCQHLISLHTCLEKHDLLADNTAFGPVPTRR